MSLVFDVKKGIWLCPESGEPTEPTMENMGFELKRCCGVISTSYGPSQKVGDRCKRVVKDIDRLLNCENPDKDLCYQHCGCVHCSVSYSTTGSRGKRHPSLLKTAKKDTPLYLLKTNDIEKLRNICIVVHDKYPKKWNNIVRLAKKRHENSKTLLKIQELESELLKLKEKLR